MIRLWRLSSTLSAWMIMISVYRIFAVDCALNNEGTALLRFKERVVNDPFGALSTWRENSVETSPCSWCGLVCVDGYVVSLNLKDLSLKGTLAPELSRLIHIKSIILRNNSFSGVIPEDIGGLKELEVLDLGYNNITGPLPRELGTNISILLLDNNNDLFFHTSPELRELMMISEVQVDESDLSSFKEKSSHNKKFKSYSATSRYMKAPKGFLRHDARSRDVASHRLLGELRIDWSREIPPDRRTPSVPVPQRPPKPRIPSSKTSAPPPGSRSSPPPATSKPSPPTVSTIKLPESPSTTPSSHSDKRQKTIIVVAATVGGFLLVSFAILLGLWRSNKLATVGPWRTGLSGPLQRSLVNGASKLNRSEIQTACEDFSNVIGCSSEGILYKGILSSGAEIAVLSHAVKSFKDWSSDLESRFRKKVEASARLNHKNFLSLLGYCEEEEPFTRMLVFEYAPSGTLFEHLHVREAEHLDWNMRLRIIMGIAYCLEHMHSLNPPFVHENLSSCAVNLNEDYAAKLSDFTIWNEVALAGGSHPPIIDNANSHETVPEDNVYSFGLILLECVTGKVPYSMERWSLDGWVLDYLRGEKPINTLVDPLLRYFNDVQLEGISEVIRSCTCQDPQERPEIGEVALKLKEITGIGMDGAAPRVSAIWWAELASRTESMGSDCRESDIP